MQLLFSITNTLCRARRTGSSSLVSGLFSRPASTRFYRLLAPGHGLFTLEQKDANSLITSNNALRLFNCMYFLQLFQKCLIMYADVLRLFNCMYFLQLFQICLILYADALTPCILCMVI